MNKELDYQIIFDACVEAGKEAIKDKKEDFYCGFAWINISPGTSSFAKWLVKNDLASKSYDRGVDIWAGTSIMGINTQSMDLKECFAEAFASKLKELGIKCITRSRAD